MDVDQERLYNTIDAAVWTEEFLKVVESGATIDFGLMVGWFANAIETARRVGVMYGEQNAAGHLLRVAEEIRRGARIDGSRGAGG